ncbi:MAG: hypothetical protein FJY85_07635, partial [Deltaproteobacteria bacterium]|nr:hypothetical protein [Deltaproteobacteria bacterium]
MTQALRDLLSSLSVPVLKDFCQTLNLHKGISRKAEFVNHLANRIEDNLAGILEELTHEDRILLAEIAHYSGHYDPAEFQAKYPGASLTRPPTSWSKSADLVWMFCTMENGRYIMNPELAANIRAILPKPREPTLITVDDIPSAIPDIHFGSRPVHVHRSSHISLIELKRVLRLVKAGRIEVAPLTWRPTGATELLIENDALVPTDYCLELPPQIRGKIGNAQFSGGVRTHAWPVLVQQCGWCKCQAGYLKLTDRGTRMLFQGDLDEFRKGVRRFIENDIFDELNRIDNITGQSGRAKRYLTRPSQRRRMIYQHMRSWPQGKWIAVPEAYRFLRASGNGFETSTQPSTLFFGPKENGDAIDSSGFLNRLYFRAFLFESLATLGLVDLAHVYPHYLWPEFQIVPNRDRISFSSRYDGLLYVGLNKLGAYCLGLVDKYDHRQPDFKGVLRILPNHEVVVLGHAYLPPVAMYMLQSIARRTNDSVWTIDRSRILDFLESGGDMEEVVAFLETGSSDAIPENVTEFLRDVAHKAGAIVGSEDTLLVELANESISAEIFRNR